MTADPNKTFSGLSGTITRLHTASDLTIDAFQHAPIVLSPLHQIRMAYGLAPKPGHALEFGVFKGKSIRNLALAYPSDHFVGFDSFEGLPEPWVRSDASTYDAGHFALPDLPPVPENVALVKGFFDQSLLPWLERNPGPISFVHIDCDLYGGAKFTLDALTDRLVDGAIIVFDELGDWLHKGVYPKWQEGEWRALNEWLTETGFSVRILSRGTRHEAAIQLVRKPVASGPAMTLAVLGAIWRSGAKPKATDMAETTFHDDTPWLPAARCFIEWAWFGNPKTALHRIEQIWKAAQSEPDSDIAIDLYHFRARAEFKLGLHKEADAHIRHYLRLRPNAGPAVSFAGSIARAKRDYKRAASLYNRWHVLTGLPKAKEVAEDCERLATIRPEFRDMKFSGLMVQHILDTKTFDSVLDIGSGAGEQTAALRNNGKTVTEVDYGSSVYFRKQEQDTHTAIIGDFVELTFDKQYDCVIASHVLEHQKNVNLFLRQAHAVLKERGILGISVPPFKHNIVGGHLTVWNAGLLLYNLVLAGFDCKNAWVRAYGHNISVVLEKHSIDAKNLEYDNGDIEKIAAFLPEGFSEGFNGDIMSLG